MEEKAYLEIQGTDSHKGFKTLIPMGKTYAEAYDFCVAVAHSFAIKMQEVTKPKKENVTEINEYDSSEPNQSGPGDSQDLGSY